MSLDEESKPLDLLRLSRHRAPRRMVGPSTSIIITSHNYGHFLGDCIESVLGQVRPADEVIVVDDGSSDGTPAVLDRYADRVQILLGPNGGQAAAFNRGFARSSGDVIVFLDADDRLRPEALEVALAHWSPDLAVLCWGLELIDASGRSLGVHPFAMRADDGDNRPRLLRPGSISGPFAFSPTSGNAWSRRFLERTLPMAEAPWRICADAYLIRAAALCGPSRALRRILGCYRAHGGNNYMRPDNFDAWSMKRGLRDLEIAAQALEGLVDDNRLLAAEEQAELIRLALRLRALETNGHIAVWTRDFRRLQVKAGSTLRGIARARLPFALRTAAAAAALRFVAASRITHRFSNPLAGQGAAPPRPAPEMPGSSAILAALASLERPRWLETVAFGRTMPFAQPGPHQNILADGWGRQPADGLFWSTGTKAAIEFMLEPAEGPVAVELKLALPEGCEGRFLITANGTRLWAGDIVGEGTASFTVDRARHLPLVPVRLEIACALLGKLRRRLRRPRLRFRLVELTVGHRARLPDHPLLPLHVPVPAAALVGRDRADGFWICRPDGTAVLEEGRARMRLTLPPAAGWVDVELTTAADCGTGWLRISCGDDDLFTGRTGPSCRLRVRSARGTADAAGALLLSFAFEPDRVDRDVLALAAIRLAETATAEEGKTAGCLRGGGSPPLDPGQTVFFAGNPRAAGYLGEGWAGVEDTGARSAATEASLGFSLPPGLEEAVLRLVLRPAVSLGPDLRHIIGLSLDGELVASAELLGEGEIPVPLPPGRVDVEMTIHSVLVTPAGGEGEPPPASLELVSLRLDGRCSVPPPLPRPPAVPALAGLLRAAARALDGEATRLDELLRIRAELAGAVWLADARALDWLAANAEELDTLVRLGCACEGATLDSQADAIAGQAMACGVAACAPDDRLRVLLAAMLLLPAHRAGLNGSFVQLPEAVLRRPDPLVAFLTREPQIQTAADHAAYLRHAEALIREADRVLAEERPGTARHGLAEAILTGLRSTASLFGDTDLVPFIRARAEAVERLLLRNGARLGIERNPRPRVRRLRVGVLVRHLRAGPEAWSALGMYRGIDNSRIERVLITLDGDDDDLDPKGVFERIQRIQPVPVHPAVEAIRAMDLDVLVLGAHVTNWEPLSLIVAHRLARVQIVSCFNSPSTLGYRSFDYAIAWKGSADARDQHLEELVESDVPLQCCFDFRGFPPVAPERGAVRRELGVPGDATLLACGAMVHKIGTELLDAWAEILAAAPRARLVLYPFAACWSLRFSPEIFRRTVAGALAARGLSTDRALVLPEQTVPEIRRLLAASDVYLDSFPYSGATTVCEALASGLPVVAREGRMLRERTGAAWLRAYGIDRLVAGSATHYVAIAGQMALDPEFRQDMTRRVEAARRGDPQPCSDFGRFGAALSDAIWNCAERSGLFPELGRAEEAAMPASAAWRRAAPARPASAPPPRRPQVRPVKFVILALARTGSTLLCEIVSRTRDALVDHELFHEEEIQLRGGVIRSPAAIERRNADPVRWLRRHLDGAEEAGYRLIGFKLFGHHPEPVLRHVTAGGYRLVVLTRENILGQYSSFRIAEQTQQWVLRPAEERQQIVLDFDPQDFERFEAMMLRLRGRLLAAAEAAPSPVLLLEYLTLADSQTAGRLSGFLGVEVPSSGRNEPTKQNLSVIAERFSAPDRVRAYLSRRGLLAWADNG